MTRHQLSLLIGGVLPAICLGLSGACQKLSSAGGIGTGPFLIVTGLTSTVVGIIFCADGDSSWTRKGILFASAFGLFWATGTGCIGLALKKYGAQISQLVPLYNMNTLVAVFIGLVAFAEWRTVQPLRISLAAILIVAGGILASKS
jgi:glucose uptake protein GlcU